MLARILLISTIVIIVYELYTQLSKNVENMTNDTTQLIDYTNNPPERDFRNVHNSDTTLAQPRGDSAAFRYDYNHDGRDRNYTAINDAFAADETLGGIPGNTPYTMSNQKNPNLFNRRRFNMMLGEDESLDNIRKGARINVINDIHQDNFGNRDSSLYDAMYKTINERNAETLERNPITHGNNPFEIKITRGVNKINASTSLANPHGTPSYFEPRTYHASGSGEALSVPVSGGRVPTNFEPMTNFKRIVTRRKQLPIERHTGQKNNTLGIFGKLKRFVTIRNERKNTNIDISNVANKTAIMSTNGRRRRQSALNGGEEYLILVENMKESNVLNNNQAKLTHNRLVTKPQSNRTTNVKQTNTRRRKRHARTRRPRLFKNQSRSNTSYNKPTHQVNVRVTNPSLLSQTPVRRLQNNRNNINKTRQIVNTLNMSTDVSKRREGIDVTIRTENNNRIYRKSRAPKQINTNQRNKHIYVNEHRRVRKMPNGIINNSAVLNSMPQLIKSQPRTNRIETRSFARNNIAKNFSHNMLNSGDAYN